MDGVFEALGEPVRRLSLQARSSRRCSPGRRCRSLPVSQHLKALREARLVSVRAEGTRRFYALDQAGLDAAEAWLARLADPLGPFAQALDALATEVARGRRSRRTAPVDQPGPRAGERGSRPA